MIRAVRRAALPVQQLLSEKYVTAVANELKFSNPESFYQALGEGRLTVQSVLTRLIRLHSPPVEEEELVPTKLRPKPVSDQGVVVQGVDDLWIKLARCCMPVPGDPIIGFVTRGRGVSIHRKDCPNGRTLASDEARLVQVSWDPNASGVFTVSVQVEALDRPKLLRDITTAISDYGVNITSATAAVGDGIANLRFTLEVGDPSQLGKIIATVRKVEAVYDAYRITPRAAS